MNLSVVIVNYNTRELTAQAVRSVLNTAKEISVEIVVVDNSDDSKECFTSEVPSVVVLKDVPNHGFGHACNVGAREASGDYLLFLNSDTIVHEGALDRSFAYLEADSSVGALGIRTLLADGTLDHGCKRGFPTPAASLYYFMGLDKKHPESKKYGAYRQTFLDEHETADTDCVSGAYLMMPRALFEELGGFDEVFFMYGEDIDLCYRIKEKGYRVVYFAGGAITHLKGESGLRAKSKTVLYHFYNAMKLFYRKHYRKRYNIFVTAAVYLGIWLKYHLALLQRQ